MGSAPAVQLFREDITMVRWTELVFLAVLVALTTTTPLDDYVKLPDASYHYSDLGNPFKGDGYTSYFINMTSQTWLSCKAEPWVKHTNVCILLWD